MKRIIDISVPVDEHVPLWPDSDGFALRRVKDQALGDPVTASCLAMDVHVGTHVDAPLHFLSDGMPIDQLALDPFIGPVDVVAVDVDAIDRDVVTRAVPDDAERVLFRTRNSARWASGTGFDPEFVALTLDGAMWLADRGVKLVGNDYLSIQRLGESDETHRVLMRAGVAILEGIDLSGVVPGRYQLVCLPLRIVGAEGAPARAVLIEEATP